eukprot:954755-Amphidinium_carterae.1
MWWTHSNRLRSPSLMLMITHLGLIRQTLWLRTWQVQALARVREAINLREETILDIHLSPYMDMSWLMMR